MALFKSKKGFAPLLYGVIFLVSLIGLGTIAHTDVKTTQNLTNDNINKLLEQYLKDYNLSNYYNYINENDLNHTYIDDGYYSTINDSLPLITQWTLKLNYIYQKLLQQQESIINLNTKPEVFNLSCDKASFYVYKPFVDAVKDNKGFELVNKLDWINNTDFLSSFFVDLHNQVIDNNLNVDYSSISTKNKAILINKNSPAYIRTTNNINLTSGEIIFNFIFNQLYSWDKNDIVTIYENNTPKLQLYLYHNQLHMKNLVNNEIKSIGINQLGVYNSQPFELHLILYKNKIDLKMNNDGVLIELNSNPFNTQTDIKFEFKPQKTKSYYLRGLYINSKVLEYKPALIKINNEYHEFDRYKITPITIYKTQNSIIYSIGNNVYSYDGNTSNYTLTINKSKLFIKNLVCEK